LALAARVVVTTAAAAHREREHSQQTEPGEASLFHVANRLSLRPANFLEESAVAITSRARKFSEALDECASGQHCPNGEKIARSRYGASLIVPVALERREESP
jgi:hypothetical protein